MKSSPIGNHQTQPATPKAEQADNTRDSNPRGAVGPEVKGVSNGGESLDDYQLQKGPDVIKVKTGFTRIWNNITRILRVDAKPDTAEQRTMPPGQYAVKLDSSVSTKINLEKTTVYLKIPELTTTKPGVQSTRNITFTNGAALHLTTTKNANAANEHSRAYDWNNNFELHDTSKPGVYEIVSTMEGHSKLLKNAIKKKEFVLWAHNSLSNPKLTPTISTEL